MAEAPSPSAILSASEISVAFGSRPLLNKATLAVLEGERVGLVGRNGCGKSTFLKIAAGVISPDSGEVNVRRGLLTGYLPQEFELEEHFTVQEAVLAGAETVRALLAEYEAVPPASPRAAHLLERIEQLDGWNIESRAKALLSHLNAPSGERRVGSLSGGEKRRVALARCLLAQPDLLILDEPTNHLDTESIQWLEEFLERYRGTCLFVTHDRYFLDRVCNRIVEIRHGDFESYPGNYTDFLITQAQRDAVEDQTERRRQKFLKQELEWVRRAPGARRTKSQDRLDRYFEAAAQEAPERLGEVELLLPPAKELGNRVITLKNVSAKTGERTLFSGLNLELEANQRLGIVGRNGSGKTTLLRLLTRESAPATGSVEHGARAEINLIDQHRLQIDPGKTVWEEVGEGRENVLIGTENVTLRAYLRRFLFQEDQMHQTIANLSGGERSRVLLAKILKRGGNVLMLDEPTNDLDLLTLRVLEDALLRFQGTVVLVSHDRYFLNRVCTHILSLEDDASVVFNVGNYDEHLAFMAKRRTRDAAKTSVTTIPRQPSQSSAIKSARPPKLTWKEERELEAMETTILEVEQLMEEAEALLHSPELYKRTAEEINAAHARAEELRTRVNTVYARWEELEAKRAASST